MSVGEEGDTRKFRRLKKSDYYESKDAYEAPTSFDRCDVCGELLSGSQWRSDEGKYVCFRCWSELKP